MDSTDILICMSADGPKYSHAMKWKIPCLKPDWVFHSIDKGYALPMGPYKITRQSNKASTPTKEDTTSVGLEEVSMCSTILNPDESATTTKVDDTVNCTVLGTLAPAIQGKTTVEWLAELDLQRVKKSGHFLDSLKIYLSGFTEEDQVLMTRVLKYAGATKLTQLVDSVTHVVNAVARNVDPETTRILKELGITPFSVSLEWIVESMKRGQKVPEKDYVFPPPENQNKSSDRVFKSPPRTSTSPAKQEETMTEENILNMYKQSKKSGIESSSTLNPDASSQVDPFFDNVKFELAGLAEEIEQDVSEWLGEVGGEVVFANFDGVVDYLITPVQGGKGKKKFKEHLNHFWIEDCLDNGKIVEKEYYHYPVKEKIKGEPLKGIVTCVSGYSGKERIYINTIISMLGGNPQEMFAKKDNKDRGVSASTHLVCPEGSGQKYSAAVKWGLPVVNKDWLMACKRECKWISEQPFLVGDATSYNKDKPLPSLEETGAELSDHDQDNLEVEDDNDDTILQEIDTNQTPLLSLSDSRRRTSLGDNTSRRRSSRGDSRRKSTKSDKDTSPEITLTRSVRTDDTPVNSRTRSAVESPAVGEENEENQANKICETPASDRLKLPVITPGGSDTPMDKYKRKPSDFYSPLPSQPWPDSQAAQTPETGVKRKRETNLDDMPTPKTPYGDHLGRDPSPATRKFYKKRYDQFKVLADQFRTNESQLLEEQKKRQEEWLKADPAAHYRKGQEAHNNMMKKIWDDYDKMELKKDGSLDERMREEWKKHGKDWDRIEEIVAEKHRVMHQSEEEQDIEEEDGDGEGVLQGITVFVARKLVQMNKDLEKIVIDLGGRIAKELDDSVTHYVFQGKNKDLSKEFRHAKEMDKIIVCPDWIYICRDENRRVEESAFPHTYNPKTNLSESQNTIQSLKRSKLKSRQKEKIPQPTFQEEEEDIDMDEDEADPKDDVTVDTRIVDDDESEKYEKKDKSSYKKDLKALESLVESMKNSPAVSLSSATKRKPMQLDMSEDNTPTATPSAKEKEKESQVLWVDPEDEKKREALALKLRMDTQDLTNMSNLNSINFSENMIEPASEIVPNHVFIIGGGVEEKEIDEAVAKLGGEVMKSGYFDKSVTHMISGKVNRSEKILGCIAAGRWVLHPSYVIDSVDAGKWLPEERYEWGNPGTDYVDLTSSDISASLSKTARRRRVVRDKGGDDIFSGMLAYINLPMNRKGSFTRLILAGGGRITDTLSDEIISSVTHVITDNKNYSSLQTKLPALADNCIPVIEAMYLNEYLLSEKASVVESFIVQEYRPLWESKKRSRVVTDTPTNVGKKSRI